MTHMKKKSNFNRSLSLHLTFAQGSKNKHRHLKDMRTFELFDKAFYMNWTRNLFALWALLKATIVVVRYFGKSEQTE